MMVGRDFSCLGLKPDTRKSAKSLYSSKIRCSLKFTILKNRRIVMKKNTNTIIDAFRGISKPVC